MRILIVCLLILFTPLAAVRADADLDARREGWMDALDADASLPWEHDRRLDDVDLPLAAHAGLYGTAHVYRRGAVVSLHAANEPADEVA